MLRIRKCRGSLTGILITAAVLVVLSTPTISYAEPWHEIVPLHSTFADVTRLLGKAFESPRAGVTNFWSGSEFVTVYTTRGDGCRSEAHIWEVPDGTVSEIAVGWAHGSRRVSDSGYVLSDFELIKDTGVQGVVEYLDRKSGLMLCRGRTHAIDALSAERR